MCREEDLFSLFTPFGTVRNLHLLKGADGKPRGCAMVRWTLPVFELGRLWLSHVLWLLA